MRLRVTVRLDAQYQLYKDAATFAAEVLLPWGDPHPTYPETRLISQPSSGQIENAYKNPNDPPPFLTRVYEEIDEENETQVGEPNITYDEDGNINVEINWIQFSTGTAVDETVGTTTAPAPYSAAILKEQIVTNDGTLRQIKRIYNGDRTLSDVQNLRFGGKVIVRTIVAIGAIPPTPAGFSLVGPGVLHPDGREIYTYEFAAAAGGGTPGTSGQISIEYSLAQGGPVDFDPTSPNTSDGVVVATVQYVTPLGVTANPIPTPSGFVLIGLEHTDDTGYILWRGRYAIGQGTVDTNDDTKYNGALLIRTITALGTAPSTPSGYTLVSTDVQESDGYTLFRSSFAKGLGEISRDIAYGQSVDEGTTGSTTTSIRYLVAPGGTIQPTSLAGSVLIKKEFTESDGYRVWSTVWAKGVGMVLNEKTVQVSDALIIYHRTGLGGAGVATTGNASSDVLTQTAHGYSNGDEVYFRALTGGTGLAIYTNYFVRDVTTDTFKLAATLGGAAIDFTTDITAPSFLVRNPLTAPSATIGGTVTIFEDSIRADSGYAICEKRWAEGDGQSSITTRGEPDGALIYTVVTLTLAAATPSYPGSGTAYLVSLRQEPKNGYSENTATYHKPPATKTFSKKANFTKPGSAVIGGSPIQFVLHSQVSMTLLADVEVSYATTQITDTPFTVSAWATYYETYTPTDTGLAVSSTQSLGGYLGGASGTSGTNSVFNGILCNSWQYSLGSSTPSSFSLDVKVLDVDNDPYLVALDGTVVYRRTKVSYDFS